jgi:hypothetical protein
VSLATGAVGAVVGAVSEAGAAGDVAVGSGAAGAPPQATASSRVSPSRIFSIEAPMVFPPNIRDSRVVRGSYAVYTSFSVLNEHEPRLKSTSASESVKRNHRARVNFNPGSDSGTPVKVSLRLFGDNWLHVNFHLIFMGAVNW